MARDSQYVQFVLNMAIATLDLATSAARLRRYSPDARLWGQACEDASSRVSELVEKHSGYKPGGGGPFPGAGGE